MRIDRLLKKLPEKVSYLVNNPIDIYYLTGLDISAGSLVVGKNSFLLVDGRYFEVCKNKSPVPVYLTKEGLIFELIEGSLWVDKESLSIGSFLNLEEKAKTKNITLRPVESQIKSLRMIKDTEEISLLREAARLGVEGFQFLKSLLKLEISEIEMASELEYFWRKKGGQGVAFEPIIAFGSNSSMPHYRAGGRALKKNDIVLIDIGVKKNHYHSDMTRVIHFGKISSQLKELHSIVQESIESALLKLRPGAMIQEIDEAARVVMRQYGYEDYFTHSLGHGVGLEIHESPLIKSQGPTCSMPLEEGMVITIEPGLYLPKIGGVRLEDTVVITATGYENLTQLPYA